MSTLPWQISLQTILRPDSPFSPRSVVLVGIGREGHGDDAVGPSIIHDLRPCLIGYAGIHLLEASYAPENLFGVILRYKPVNVVFIDATSTGEPPGAIQWLSIDAAGGCSASTHTLPLSLVGRFISKQGHCEVNILGIEAANLGAGEPLSPAVREAAHRIEQTILGILQQGDQEAALMEIAHSQRKETDQ